LHGSLVKKLLWKSIADPEEALEEYNYSPFFICCLEEFCQVYMPGRNLAGRTREEYEKDLKDVIQFLEKRGLSTWQEVTLKDLYYYQAELDRRHLEPLSCRRRTSTVKTFFTYLEEFNHLQNNAALRLLQPKAPDHQPRFLTQREYERLLAYIQDPRDRAIVELGLQAGLRISELAALTLANIEVPQTVTQDQESLGWARVLRKGAKCMIPFNGSACTTLQHWLKQRAILVTKRGIQSEALWLSRLHKPLTVKGIRNLVKKYLEQAKIMDASVQTLRHTMAVRYLANGEDKKRLQQLLGYGRVDNL
jgi:site-specific recombinase XerD